MKVVENTTFHTLYSIYIYIYSSVFQLFHAKSAKYTNKRVIQRENGGNHCVFRKNEQKQIISLRSHGYFMRFYLYLRKSACAATITGNLHMISWRNRPRIPATDAKISPLPVIYPPPPGYALRLAVWRTFLIFQKIFGIIYIESKGEIKQIQHF